MGTFMWHKPDGVSALDAIIEDAGGEEEWRKDLVVTAPRQRLYFVSYACIGQTTISMCPDADGFIRALLIYKLQYWPNHWGFGDAHHNFGYSPFDESNYPFGCCEAPRSILAHCSDLQPDACDEYRKRCIRREKKRAQNKAYREKKRRAPTH
jgi:hypothetical protein